MLEKLKEFLKRVVSVYDQRVVEFTERSQEHANRRTITILVSVGTVFLVLYVGFIRPPDDFPLNTLVTVEEGMSLKDVAHQLEEDSVVRSPLALRMLVTISGNQKNVHAGDYLFKEPLDIFSVARVISIGAYGLEPIRIRIPEGATTKEMTDIFARNLERFNAERFLKEAQPLEGFLFPDTYFFLPNAREDIVLRTMQQNFDAHEQTIRAEIEAFGKPLRDIVIMASILEREASIPEDRRMISGVLWNRIKRGMLLQVDAAFLYILGKGTYQLTEADLAIDSPYNTYRYKGLPAGPIGSPSLDSMIAAITPTKNDYLYYLADKSGVTYYSKTYAEHLKKKALYID